MGRGCATSEVRSGYQSFPFWALAGALFGFAAIAQAQPPITSMPGCGKITKSGLYSLDALTVAAAAGDCITITASNVVLDLNGATLTGSGSGAGVHLATKATSSFIEGRAATISGFSDGIEIDGSKTTVENLTVTSNTDAGLLLKSASQTTVSNLSASTNGHDGIRVYKGSYNTLGGNLSVTANGRYGIWLQSTSNNDVAGFWAQDNARAGVYVGCSADGPAAAPCKPAAPISKGNALFNGRVQASSPDSQAYGIVLDAGDDFNRITNISSGSPYERYDLDDENPGCAHNAWFGHGIIFSLSPIDCIN